MRLLHCALLYIFLFISPAIVAQTDSVTVTGRIRNLTPQLYRRSPQVLITRTNILQASQEIAHPAPLDAEGRFRVKVPLIYPQEELTFNFNTITTGFLAAPGTLSIDLNADSLYVAEVPFRFGGVNAQVNQQYARYRAYEAQNRKKPDWTRLTRQAQGRTPAGVHRYLVETFTEPLRAFAANQRVLPLLSRWLTSVARYDAATFQYEQAMAEGTELPAALNDSLRPADDRLLTVARATAMERFSQYAVQTLNSSVITGSNQAGRSLPVPTLASLVERYGKNLTESERQRLRNIGSAGAIKPQDLRFVNSLVERSADLFQRLMTYEALIRQSQNRFDTPSVDYLRGYALVSALPTLTLTDAQLFYGHIRPQIKDAYLGPSLSDVYYRETKDSLLIREAAGRLATGDSLSGLNEIAPGIFATRNRTTPGSQLFSKLLKNNAGKVVYALIWSPSVESSQQVALAAQRLRDVFSPRELSLLYIAAPDVDPTLWQEFIVKRNLKGDHLYLSAEQWSEGISQLGTDYITVFDRAGKRQRRSAIDPQEFDKLVTQLQKLL
ncbi:hypothetical protein GCM10023189_07630 [Nibrella saemangeumensis]|uniref:Thioredoxin domain-containing protein n=1 Tax=Nibrella saemangeumensis TaxID=1084526 RepID=A0ABP8MG06_9BACT